MMDSKPMSTPMESGLQLFISDSSPQVYATLYQQIIGGLIYLTYARLDIDFVVNYLSRFMQEPKTSHWLAAKRVLRYIHGTMDHGLEYKKNDQFFLTGYTDADYAGSVDDRKSTSRFVFFLGSGPISRGSKKQATVAHSSTEA
ncbi:secreted RxLR effector protein 161-like [Cryptomeria japonica]|uniref:secreted RxLR effector protein 161-like n=1 Tax=Cryptomeria japonica TaxID=3369 RepID=UPI0025AC4180|nr:secreted RxLR effector protein 161-like [Cryptomeria japonica]